MRNFRIKDLLITINPNNNWDDANYEMAADGCSSGAVVSKPTGPGCYGPSQPTGPGCSGPSQPTGPGCSGPSQPTGPGCSGPSQPTGPNCSGPSQPTGPNCFGPSKPTGPEIEHFDNITFLKDETATAALINLKKTLADMQVKKETEKAA